MRRFLHDAWWRLATATHPRLPSERLFGLLLEGGAVLYGWAIRARNHAYDRRWIRPVTLPYPVISVGNLTVGGTGKTACVEWLAHALLRQGRRVAILSRGYSGKRSTPYVLQSHGGHLLANGQPTGMADGIADEPQLLAWHLPEVPILVGRRREQTGRQACEQFQANVLILDDGFQYRKLDRRCEIVLVSARMPLGGWLLLPRGPMREPLSALRRADVIMITKVDESMGISAALQERLRMLNPHAVMVTAIHEPMELWNGRTDEPLALSQLERRPVGLLSSIGDPDGFEHSIRNLGASVGAHLRYPDHYPYAARDWQTALEAARTARAEALVTTEKDFIRLRRFCRARGDNELPVWVLRVRIRLMSGEQEFHDRLAAVCAG